jgi:uncharacterized membrane protein YoaK (UPF0700 family)
MATDLTSDRPHGRTGRPNSALAFAPADRPIAIPILLVLNVATGAVEAVCYGHLGQIFAAFITGTIILAGLHIGSGGFDLLKPYIFPIAGFICGGIVGGRLVRSRTDIGRTFARIIAIESVILASSAICAALLPLGVNTSGRYLTLALLSLAMGTQFSATKFLNVPDLTLAALTGVIHGLLQDSRLARGHPQRSGRRIGAIIAIAVGAAMGAALATWQVPAAIGAGAALVAISAFVAAIALKDQPADETHGSAARDGGRSGRQSVIGSRNGA